MGKLTAFSFSLADQGFCDWLEKHLQSQDLIKAHKSDGSIEVDRNAMIESVRSGSFSQYELSEPQKRYLYDLAKNGRIFLQASDHDTEAFLSDRVQAFFIAIHRENLGLKEKDSWNLGHRFRSKVLDTGTEEKDLEALFRRFSDPQELQLFIKLIERHPSAEGKSIAQILEAELSSKELGRVWGVLQSKLKSKYDYQALAYQNYTDDLIRLEKINTQAGHKTLAVHHESSKIYEKWQRTLSRRSQELALSEASLKKIQDPRLTLLLLASADALKLDEKVKERLDLYRLDREITDQRGSRKAVESKAEFFEWMREETDSSSFDEKYSKFKQSLGDLLAYLENGVGLEEGQIDALETLLLELHAEQEILLQGEEEGLRGAELGLMGSEEGAKILLGAAVTLWSRGALSSVLGTSFGATTLTSIVIGTGFETASRMEAEYLASGEIKNSSGHFQISLGNAYKTVTAANIGTGVRLLGNAGAQLSKSKAMGVYASTERIPLHLGVAHVLSKSGTVQRMVSNPLIGVHHSALLGQYENIRGDNLAWWVLNAGGQRLNDKLMNSHMLHRLGEMGLEAGEELGENQLNSYGGNDAYQVAVSMSAGLTEVSGKFDSSSSHLTSHFVQELGAYALANPRTITSVLLLASAVLPTVIQGELNWTTLSILPALFKFPKYTKISFTDRITYIRAIAGGDPSRDAFEDLCHMIEDLEGGDLAIALQLAQESMDLHWPDGVRYLKISTEEFLESPPVWLSLVRHIHLYPGPKQQADWARVFASEHLLGIRELTLAHARLGQEGLSALVQSGLLQRTHSVNFTGNNLDPEGMRVLMEGDVFPSLTSLDLGGNRLSAEGVRTLVEAGPFPNLTHLDLGFNQLGVEGVRALLESDAFPSLTGLFLDNNGIDKEAIQVLASTASFPHLTHLDLRSNGIGASGMAVLILADFFSSLTYLDLSSNQLGADGAAELGKMSALPQFKYLDLALNGLGPKGVQALFPSGPSPSLVHLDLRNNQLSDKGLAKLGELGTFPNLAYLNLASSQFGSAGILSLFAEDPFPRLTHLDLSYNQIGPEGAQRLSETPNLSGLHELYLSSNCIGVDGGIALAASPNLANLRRLNLYGNGLGRQGVMHLAMSPHLRYLRDLALGGNDVDDAAMMTLLASPNSSGLRSLDLELNLITDEGLELLLLAHGLTYLSKLNLSGNKLITDDALSYVSQSPFLKSLRLLFLRATKATSYGIKMLRKMPFITVEADE